MVVFCFIRRKLIIIKGVFPRQLSLDMFTQRLRAEK